MRIKAEEAAAIKEIVGSYDPGASVYLFGSRADDSKRGGDIDLLVLSKRIGLEEKYQIRRKICDRIGEQKIDLLIAENDSPAFVKMAMEEGVLL